MTTTHKHPSDTLGQIDHYTLFRKLGGGGFGVVYLARDTVSGIDVAIKTLHPLINRSTEEMEALRENFALVSRLAHPNIATALVLHRVHDFRLLDKTVRRELRLVPGDSVMVMRYAPGVTLSQWRRQFRGGVVPLEKALEVGRQIASALDYAHEEGIVHRDIKPSNIMIETLDDGRIRARVLDFGIAAEIRLSLSRVSTEKGDTSGTPPYMSPEQWQGKKQNGRTDQYALACVLYELLSGAPPFASVFSISDPGIQMATVITQKPETLDSLNPKQNKALLKALSKTPSKRFGSCSDLIRKLQARAQESARRSETKSKTKEDSEVWFQRGISFLNGKDVPRDDQKALYWFRMATLLGHSRALYYLGLMYEAGRGVQLDYEEAYEEAVKWYRQAAEQGDMDALNRFAEIVQKRFYSGEEWKERAEEVIIRLRKAAGQGYAVAQYNLGMMFALGFGVERSYEEAVKWFRMAAEQGYDKAQAYLASVYQSHYQNYQEAVKWYRMAAEQGNISAQCWLGRFFEVGRGVPQDAEEAVKWYRKAAEQGYPDAQVFLGRMFSMGKGVAQSDEEAVKWYRMAAEKGDRSALYRLGTMYKFGFGVKQDYEKAVKLFQEAAELGAYEAQDQLGLCYYFAHGVRRSGYKALKWFLRAAAGKDAEALYHLGMVYERGVHGITHDYVEALKWYHEAAEQRQPEALYCLGEMYEHGRGVPQDYVEAVKWYREAADEECPAAKNRLGLMFKEGRGVMQSDEEAVKWFRAAAEKGYVEYLDRGAWFSKGATDAQYNLAKMYETGRGVTQNNNEAVKWYRCAAQQGLEDAVRALRRLGVSKE